MKVKVRDGFQIKHDGKRYVGGDVFDVQDSQGKRWIDAGIAAKAASKPKKKAVTKSKNKAVQSSANKSSG